MRTSLLAILLASGAADAAVVPDLQTRPLEAVADRMHTTVVQVVADAGGGRINAASGVLAGDGLVLTDLRAVIVQSGVELVPASAIAVVTAKGVFAAHIIQADIDVDVAVLALPGAAPGMDAPELALDPASKGDQLLAIRAGQQGGALLFEVIAFSIQQAEGEPARLETQDPLPITFVGAPVFDAGGSLAGLLVSPNARDGLLVPAARLRQILARARSRVTGVDEHI